MLVVAQMGTQLALERRLDDQLGQLRQQTALAIDRQPLPLGITHQPGHQLLVHHQRRLLDRRHLLLQLGRLDDDRLNLRAHDVPP